VASFAAVAISSQVDQAASDQPPLPRATVTISPNATALRVPRSYLGLSTEYWSLPLYADHLRVLERVIGLLHVRGDGPMVLRIGGDSADQTFWDPRHTPLPPWAYPISPRWTREVSRLVRRLGLRLIVNLNVITNSPAGAVRLAQAAEARLPRHSIIGFEIGNEPDIYRLPAWEMMTGGQMVGADTLPPALTAADYAVDFQRFSEALRRVAPGVPLLGPALANPLGHLAWLPPLLAAHLPDLRTVTIHRYLFSGCVGRSSHRYPTIAKLLRPASTVGMANSLSPAIGIAHSAGLPIRLTEMDSVDCGGRAGVSDTFATALWAPDALFNLLRAGADGVNIHVRARTVNAAYAFDRRGLVAHPLLYGLLMFVRTLGWRPRWVPLQLRARPSLNLAAWAVRTGTGRPHVLLLNKGPRSVRFRLLIPTRGAATVQRLVAPSVRSLSGETLDGQRLGPDGTWTGSRQMAHLTRTRHGYVVVLPRFSEALVSARLDPGALRHIARRQI
jgi:hypothetical protein